MRSRFLFAALAVAVGVTCIRLGFWQLDRREQRRARNAEMAARLQLPPADVAGLPRDTVDVRFRRARIRGIADYEHELILAGRTRDGSPGVNLLTPVRVPGRDTAVLVNRGWVYSPDAATPAAGDWREGDTVAFEGYADVLGDGPDAPVNPARPRLLPRASLASARARVPYPISGTYLVAQAPVPADAATAPARLVVPAVGDEGPHLGYALQWFAFATIAFVGAGIALKRR